MNEYIIITLLLIAITVGCTFLRPLRRVRSAVIKMFSGFALLAVTATFANTLVPIGINLFTVTVSLLLGVPGTCGMIAVAMML